MATGLADAKRCLQAAQQRMKQYADRSRREVFFAEGDQVLLSTKNLALHKKGDRTSTPKLFPKYIGPFQIEKRVGQVAYKLILAEGMRIHPVFHVSLLKPYRSDGQVQPPDPLILEDEASFQLERILDHKSIRIGRKTQREYLVKWHGHASDHNSWVPESSLVSTSEEVLRAYWDYIGYEPPAIFPDFS